MCRRCPHRRPRRKGCRRSVDRQNLYSEVVAGRMSPAVSGALERVYVPNRAANSVSVIDPRTLKVIDTFKVGVNPQHVVPSWDLKTLWVANNAERTDKGSLTPIDPTDRQAGAQRGGGRSLQHVLEPGRFAGDRGCRSVQAPRFPRSPHPGAEVLDRHARVRRHQPRRFLDRWSHGVLHLRVQRQSHENRSRQSACARHHQAEPVLRTPRSAVLAGSARQEAAQDSRPVATRRRDLHHAGHAAGCARPHPMDRCFSWPT